MKLTCISAFGDNVPGDEVDVPDGAFDPAHWRRADSGTPAAEAAPTAAAAGTTSPLDAATRAAAAAVAELNGDGHAS